MTKPLPIGSIKSMKKIPNLCKVNMVIEDFLSTIIFLFSKYKQKKVLFSTKYTHQYLEKRKLFLPPINLFFNSWTLWDLKEPLTLVKQRLKHIQQWNKNVFSRYMLNTCTFLQKMQLDCDKNRLTLHFWTK